MPLQKTIALNRPAIILKDKKEAIPLYMKDLKKMCFPFGMPKNVEIDTENASDTTI